MHIWSGIVSMGRALGVGVCKGKLESKNKMRGRGGKVLFNPFGTKGSVPGEQHR